MESILNLIVNAENVRMLVILAFVCSGYVLMNKKIDDLKHSDLAAINKRIDELKYNDFAHLNNTIEALTYALEKNGSLKKEDKEYVDSRLAR